MEGIDGNNDEFNGVYEFVKSDDAGFPVYAVNGDEFFIYVTKQKDGHYWHFNYVQDEASAYIYSVYSQNCPAAEVTPWFFWLQGQWSELSAVQFEI